jgi:hypothetical protein
VSKYFYLKKSVRNSDLTTPLAGSLSSGVVSANVSSCDGVWIKVGKIVHIFGRITTNAVFLYSANALFVEGLPAPTDRGSLGYRIPITVIKFDTKTPYTMSISAEGNIAVSELMDLPQSTYIISASYPCK